MKIVKAMLLIVTLTIFMVSMQGYGFERLFYEARTTALGGAFVSLTSNGLGNPACLTDNPQLRVSYHQASVLAGGVNSQILTLAGSLGRIGSLSGQYESLGLAEADIANQRQGISLAERLGFLSLGISYNTLKIQEGGTINAQGQTIDWGLRLNFRDWFKIGYMVRDAQGYLDWTGGEGKVVRENLTPQARVGCSIFLPEKLCLAMDYEDGYLVSIGAEVYPLPQLSIGFGLNKEKPAYGVSWEAPNHIRISYGYFADVVGPIYQVSTQVSF